MSKKAKYLIILPIFLVLSGNAYSQSSYEPYYFWKLHTISGEARLDGHYREQERIGTDIYEYEKSSYLSGGVLLDTKSSILNQNFLMLDINAGYIPGTSKDDYIVIPDQAEVRTFKKLGVGATFFQQKNINLNMFGDYDESYSTRENLTNIRSTNKHWGGILNYTNKYLPVTLDFHNRQWDEEEIDTDRRYSLDQILFGARMNKSFTKNDRNEFKYSHDENVNINQNAFRVENIIDNIDLISHVNLDSDQKYIINSLISNFSQHGYTNLQRFQINESFNALLTNSLSFFSNYNFYDIHQDQSDLIQNNLNTSLEHRLFKSLRSRINFDFNKIDHTVYQELNTKPGIEFNYTKEITNGQLLMSYRFDKYHQDYASDPVALNISNEQYILSDTKIVLLRLSDIILESVVVKDATGTIIYDNGLDYILIERDPYIEIRRIPGGLIANESVVLIDYTANQPGDYKYDANTHVFASSIYLLKNVLSFNYRFSTQDYSNLENTEFVALNYFTQNLVGCRLDFGFINGGAEYEDYKSSILPYRMKRYYMNFQKNYGQKLMLTINGNMQDYVMLDEPEPQYQQYLDVTGKAIYAIFKETNLNLDLMYRKQQGRGIDLDLMTAKTEVTTVFNRLYLTVGVEVYKRNYVGEIINFKGTYAKIIRKF